MLDDDSAQSALHDAAYRYAFRRSLSGRLASSAAREAVGSLTGAPVVGPRDPGEDALPPPDLVAVLRATRTVLERYLPTTLPPRAVGDPSLRASLADLSSADRELLLLHHWDGLPVGDAARLSGSEPGRLPAVEAACALSARRDAAPAGGATAGGATAGPAVASALPGAGFLAALAAADPAASITREDLARSRSGLPGAGLTPSSGELQAVTAAAAPSTVEERATAAASGTSAATATVVSAAAPASPVPAAVPTAAHNTPAATARLPRFPARAPRRQVQMILGTLCLLAVVAGLATALIPRATPGPAGDAERLFALADVVAVVSIADLVPTQVDGELRMLQAASVVQIVKGDAERTTLTIDVTGRSTLERPFSRNLFVPNQLMFLVRDGDGILSPIEGDGSILTLIDRRSPETTTISGEPAPLPDELRDAIRALPPEELTLDTNGTAPGLLPAEAVLGTRPPEGGDAQNLSRAPLGTFRVLPAGAGRACVVFEYSGRSVLLRWPEGFSAYERVEVLSYPNGDPRRGRQVLTVLNDRGYPYVDDQRQSPFISGAPTGGRGGCGGQELEVWDIAVEPGTTLLSY